ncbi:MAG: hypothetical protein HYZ29_06095 [Myxococcales bacterium]|nr:hypothetical protein [Myxococcales bacterium]
MSEYCPEIKHLCAICGAELEVHDFCGECVAGLQDYGEDPDDLTERRAAREAYRSSPEGRAEARAFGRKVKLMQQVLAVHGLPHDWKDAKAWVRVWGEDEDDPAALAAGWLRAGWDNADTVRAAEAILTGPEEDVLDWLADFRDLSDAQLAPFEPTTREAIEEHKRKTAELRLKWEAEEQARRAAEETAAAKVLEREHDNMLRKLADWRLAIQAAMERGEFGRRTSIFYSLSEAQSALTTARNGGPAHAAVRAFERASNHVRTFEGGRFLITLRN